MHCEEGGTAAQIMEGRAGRAGEEGERHGLVHTREKRNKGKRTGTGHFRCVCTVGEGRGWRTTEEEGRSWRGNWKLSHMSIMRRKLSTQGKA